MCTVPFIRTNGQKPNGKHRLWPGRPQSNRPPNSNGPANCPNAGMANTPLCIWMIRSCCGIYGPSWPRRYPSWRPPRRHRHQEQPEPPEPLELYQGPPSHRRHPRPIPPPRRWPTTTTRWNCGMRFCAKRGRMSTNGDSARIAKNRSGPWWRRSITKVWDASKVKSARTRRRHKWTRDEVGPSLERGASVVARPFKNNDRSMCFRRRRCFYFL